MKHFFKLFIILILFSAVSCTEPFVPELDTGHEEEEEPDEPEPVEVIEEVFILPEDEPLPPLPADDGIVNQTGKVAFIAPSEWALYLFDIETGQTTFVTDSIKRDIRWSRDGEWIAYSGFKEAGADDVFSGSIYMIKADGSEKRLVTMDNSNKFGIVYPTEGITPVWSPDATRIAFTRGSGWIGGNSGNIYIIDIDTIGGIKEEKVTSTILDFLQDWSPDGEHFIFRSALTLDNIYVPFYEEDWYTIRQNGTEKTLIATSNRTVTLFGFRYSPDGDRLAFIGGSEKYEIYIMDIDGSNIIRITDNDHGESQLSWSPDGTSIMYMTGDSKVFIINIDRSGIKKLDIGMEIGRSFDWRPKL